jgi:hypothetical protein
MATLGYSPRVDGQPPATNANEQAPVAVVPASSPEGADDRHRAIAIRVQRALASPDIIVLVLLPFVLLITTPDWTYQPPYGFIDPYIYTGFFRHLHSLLDTYWNSYYASRLPWLLVGNAAYTLLSPEAANLLLRFLLLYISVFSIYGTVRIVGRDRLAATLAAVALAVNVHFLAAIRWDYVDGPGIAGLFATILLLTCAAKSARPAAWLFAAGFMAMTAVSTQLFLVSTLPALACWYVLLNLRYDAHSALRMVPWLFGGAIVGFELYAAVNFLLEGQFLYLKPQIDHLRHPNPSDHFGLPFSQWTRSAGWLVVPAAAGVVGIGALVAGLWHSWRRGSMAHVPGDIFFAAVAGLQFLAVALVYVVTEFLRGEPVLQLNFYASYLIPFAFIVLGAAIAAGLKRLDASWALAAGATAVGILLLSQTIDPWLPLTQRTGCGSCSLRGAGLSWALVLGALALAAVLRRSPALALLAVVALTLVNPTTGVIAAPAGSHERFRLVNDTVAVVDRFNQDGKLYFWYSNDEPLANVYRAISSQRLWGFRLLNEVFPATDQVHSRVWAPGTRAAIFSDKPEAQAIGAANQGLAGLNLQLQVLHHETVHRGGEAFVVWIVTFSPTSKPP